MSAIENLLALAGQQVMLATAGGKPVHPGNAYTADPVVVAGPLIFVECAIPGVNPVAVIDHHRVGDPGYGRPPAEFWQASSLGQVYAWLEVRGLLPQGLDLAQLRLVAAADHCLGAAYRGQCPGVDPAALAEWRVASRAAFQRLDPAALRAKVEAALCALADLPSVTLGASVFRDARGGEIPELPEASARAGQPVLYRLVDTRAGRVKVGVLGGEPAEIRDFLAHVGQLGLVDPYGDPARGFAGAYEP